MFQSLAGDTGRGNRPIGLLTLSRPYLRFSLGEMHNTSRFRAGGAEERVSSPILGGLIDHADFRGQVR
jgi:hypothetical protein